MPGPAGEARRKRGEDLARPYRRRGSDRRADRLLAAGARGAIGKGLGRLGCNRPDAGRRALQRPGRPHPGVDRARRRRHRPADRGQRARARGAARLDRLRADQRFRRAIDPPYRSPALPFRRLRPRLARSRLVANRDHHRQSGRGPRTRGQRGGGRFPLDPRSGNDRDLCRGTAHADAAAALFVGARRVQGQVDQPHALRGDSRSASPVFWRCFSPSSSWCAAP